MKKNTMLLGLALCASTAASAADQFNYTQADNQVRRSVERDGEQGMLRFYEEYFRANLAPSGEGVHTQRMAARPPVEEMSEDPTGTAERLETQIAEFAPERSSEEQMAGRAAPEQTSPSPNGRDAE